MPKNALTTDVFCARNTPSPVPRWRRNGVLPASFAALLLLSVRPDNAPAQGCVASRGAGITCQQAMHPGEPLPPESGLQAGVGYRWLDSHRPFVGDQEQKQQEQEGSEFINHSHFIDLALTYAFNPRFSGTLTLPFSIHDRSQVVRSNDVNRTILERFHTQSGGLGDIRLEGNGWLLDPHTHMKANILLGAGARMPTGEKDARDTFQVYQFRTRQVVPENRTVDQSIQPGDGGWGLILDLYSYWQFAPRWNGFLSGNYTITPEEENGVPTYISNPYEAVMSIADSYQARGGFEFLLWPKAGLIFSLAGRIDGVPVQDAIGGSEGFRRPGFAVSIEPGLSLSLKTWSFYVYTPVALHRNRQQSVPEKELSADRGTYVNSGASFADYLIQFGLTKRF